MVDLLKNDLEEIKMSRMETDATHKRAYNDCLDKNDQLEINLMDKEDEIKELKKQIEDLQSQVNSGGSLSLHDAAYFKQKYSNPFSCFDFEDDVVECQPQARETAFPEAEVKMDELVTESDDTVVVFGNGPEVEKDDFVAGDEWSEAQMDEEEFDIDAVVDKECSKTEENEECPTKTDEIKEDHVDSEECDENVLMTADEECLKKEKASGSCEINQDEASKCDNEEGEERFASFEEVASTCIKQAILSKLSSARVRLELDGLIAKYNPTPEIVSAVLAAGLLDWVSSSVELAGNSMTTARLFMTTIQDGMAGFWESVLQHYHFEESYQLQFLKEIESLLVQTDKIKSSEAIIGYFDRMMLLLYKYDVVDDDAVVLWWGQRGYENSVSQRLRKVTTRFVDWVKEDDGNASGDEGEKDETDQENEDKTASSDTEPEEEDQAMIDSMLETHNRYSCVSHLGSGVQPSSVAISECTCGSKPAAPSGLEKPKKSVTISL